MSKLASHETIYRVSGLIVEDTLDVCRKHCRGMSEADKPAVTFSVVGMILYTAIATLFHKQSSRSGYEAFSSRLLKFIESERTQA